MKQHTPRLFLDDLAPGLSFRSGTVDVTADEIRSFAGQFDPQPFHLDDAAAHATLFGGLAASGWHTAALTMRLIVESLPFDGGLIGTHCELAWPLPTRPGDRLHVEGEIVEISPSRSKPDRGIVVMRSRTINQDDGIVQTLTASLLVFRRPATDTV
ncbi:dehydratase [Rhizobium sp. Leaf384]|jgi:acyl dehydratase|uniref:MaoC family dehydratase n=1 Tax=unclassified Rhizobium TaxID=2613769 RepID=UPI0007162210|nr:MULTISPECIES: MaoC family dehydratase [unclassified Rhizobium]KQR69328.1 dehydratase [Rhizobium sp. Leaf341]KQS77102.1 dehydratase [Rhizobium sp. Leaf384]KQS78373.1 dehydratase [Rhizobium sp. Leaf383]